MNKIIFIVSLLFLIAACNVKTYKADIHQGNVITLQDINKIKIGMTKEEVEKILGSPAIIDLFHNNQWEYINYSKMPNSQDIKYHISLKFAGNTLKEINKKDIAQLEKATVKIPKEEVKKEEKPKKPWYQIF